jgi:hypothetical protein
LKGILPVASVCFIGCFSASSLALDSIKQHLNDLFWVIYDKPSTFTQLGVYSLATAERGLAFTQEVFPATKTSNTGDGLPLPVFEDERKV